MMQKDQVSGTIDRALAVLATIFLGWFVKKGYIGESDAATLLPFVVLLPAIFWGWWGNRDKALLQSAANVPGTVILTTPAMADATPAEPNILPSAAPQEKITAMVNTVNVAAALPPVK